MGQRSGIAMEVGSSSVKSAGFTEKNGVVTLKSVEFILKCAVVVTLESAGFTLTSVEFVLNCVGYFQISKIRIHSEI